MTIPELIADLIKKYPRSADQIEAFAPQYRQLLQFAEGPRLAEAYMFFMTGKKSLFWPKPFEIAEQLPARTRITGDGSADIHKRTEAERKTRVDAANIWWRENGTELALFYEYEFRCRYGLPTPDDLADFEIRNRARIARMNEPPIGPLKPIPSRNPIRVPMQRSPPPPPIDETPPPTSEEDYGKINEEENRRPVDA